MAVLRKNYLGIDVSKPWFDVSLLVILNHVKQPMITERFDNNAAGMKLFKNGLKPRWLVLTNIVYWLSKTPASIIALSGAFAVPIICSSTLVMLPI